MNIRRIHPRAGAFAFAALGLAACSDRIPTQDAPAPEQHLRARIDCVAQVRSRQIACGAPTTAARGNIILGGQGVNVRLASSGTSYDSATATLQSTVTVQNLLNQPMGTPDGGQVTGINVFFATGPTVQAGSGTVEVLADSIGSFTSAGQPYYHYPQLLKPGSTSAGKTWRFSVPVSVTTFVFSVYVETRLPSESGILRWTASGPTPPEGTMQDVWSPDGQLVIAVGAVSDGDTVDKAVIARSTDGGAHWSTAYTQHLSPRAIWGNSAADIWMADGYGGILHSVDGGVSWMHKEPAATVLPVFTGIWSRGDTVIAAGFEFVPAQAGYVGVILRTLNGGTDWTRTQTDSTPNDLFVLDVHGNGTDVWASGTEFDKGANKINGFVMHSPDGGATWTRQSLSPSVVSTLDAIWSAPGAGVYAVGSLDVPALPGIVLHSTDGTNWNVETPTSPAGHFYGVFGTSASDIHVVGDAGTSWRYDSSSWARLTTGTSETLLNVFGTSSRSIWAVGVNGTMLHGVR